MQVALYEVRGTLSIRGVLWGLAGASCKWQVASGRWQVAGRTETDDLQPVTYLLPLATCHFSRMCLVRRAMLANVREEPSFQTLHHGQDEEGDQRGGQR
jgi:hypothetical protein